MNDPIADMIVRIKNAGDAGRRVISFPYSKIKMSLATLLKNHGFLKNVSKDGKKVNKTIEVELLINEDKTPRVKGVRRVSKFSRRIYVKSREIKPVKSGFGKLILSTSKGILTGNEAKSLNLGGEVLFEIW